MNADKTSSADVVLCLDGSNHYGKWVFLGNQQSGGTRVSSYNITFGNGLVWRAIVGEGEFLAMYSLDDQNYTLSLNDYYSSKG